MIREDAILPIIG